MAGSTKRRGASGTAENRANAAIASTLRKAGMTLIAGANKMTPKGKAKGARSGTGRKSAS